MTEERFKELCDLITSEEFLEFLNTITTQRGVIHIKGTHLKNGNTVGCLWTDVHCDAIGINHGEYKSHNKLL